LAVGGGVTFGGIGWAILSAVGVGVVNATSAMLGKRTLMVPNQETGRWSS
jgi:hypothetical protein